MLAAIWKTLTNAEKRWNFNIYHFFRPRKTAKKNKNIFSEIQDLPLKRWNSNRKKFEKYKICDFFRIKSKWIFIRFYWILRKIMEVWCPIKRTLKRQGELYVTRWIVCNVRIVYSQYPPTKNITLTDSMLTDSAQLNCSPHFEQGEYSPIKIVGW